MKVHIINEHKVDKVEVSSPIILNKNKKQNTLKINSAVDMLNNITKSNENVTVRVMTKSQLDKMTQKDIKDLLQF